MERVHLLILVIAGCSAQTANWVQDANSGAYVVEVTGLGGEPAGEVQFNFSGQRRIPGFNGLKLHWHPDSKTATDVEALLAEHGDNPLQESCSIKPVSTTTARIDLELTEFDKALGRHIVSDPVADAKCIEYLKEYKSADKYLDAVISSGLDEDSVMVAWFAGRYKGVQLITEYTAFIIRGLIFENVAMNAETLQYEGVVENSDGTKECVIYGVYYNVLDVQVGNFTAEQLIAGGNRWNSNHIDNFRFMWGIKYNIKLDSKMAATIVIDVPPGVLYAANGLVLRSKFDHQLICSIFCQYCQPVDNLWQTNGFNHGATGFSSCVETIDRLASENEKFLADIITHPMQVDGNYSLQGNTAPCRFMHASMLMMNPQIHCHHVSLVPSRDPGGDYFCTSYEWLERRNYSNMAGRFFWERGMLLSSTEFKLQKEFAMLRGGPFFEKYGIIVTTAGGSIDTQAMGVRAVPAQFIYDPIADVLKAYIPADLACGHLECLENSPHCMDQCSSDKYFDKFFKKLHKSVPAFSADGHLSTNSSTCGSVEFPKGKSFLSRNPKCRKAHLRR